MSEAKRVQVVRPHEKLDEYMYRQEEQHESNTNRSHRRIEYDDHKIIVDRLNKIQSLAWRDKWPFIASNLLPAVTSGFIGGAIGRKMGKNLVLGSATNIFGTSAGPWFLTAASHLLAYTYMTVKPLCSDNPMVCPTCLEIRAFAIGSAFPILFGATASTLGNISTVAYQKLYNLPDFKISAYKKWFTFFEKYAFKGMAHRHFLFYPLVNGFFTSICFAGQSYYWHNYLRELVVRKEN